MHYLKKKKAFSYLVLQMVLALNTAQSTEMQLFKFSFLMWLIIAKLKNPGLKKST